MAIHRIRRVVTNEAIFDQVDVFQENGFDRVTGLVSGNISLKVFWNNQVQPWTLVDGASVNDALVVAGKVYWQEIPGAVGFYSVRWRALGTGFWRLVLTYSAGSQTTLLDYDVVAEPQVAAQTGLKASFSKP